MERECRMNSKYVCWRQFSKEKKVEDAAVTYRGEKLLEYAMKVPERVMKRRNRLLINVDSMLNERLQCSNPIGTVMTRADTNH